MTFLGAWNFWRTILEVGLPIGLAALGVLVTSKAGFLNIGVEGVMLCGAFLGVAGVVWTGSWVVGLLIALAGGAVINVLCVWLSYKTGMGTVLAGLAIDVAALGVTSTLAGLLFASGTSVVGGVTPSWLPYAGDGFVVAGAVALKLFLGRTHRGLIVTAIGEHAEMATAFGIEPFRARLVAAAIGGTLIGLGGAVLTLVDVGSFTVGVTEGRGFVALAGVILGAWSPIWILVAAFGFGVAESLHFSIAAEGHAVLGQLLDILPYVATLVAMALLWGRGTGPAEEGKHLEPSRLGR